MTPPLDGIPTTKHLFQRWAERHPGEDIVAAFARSVRVPLHKLCQWGAAAGRQAHFRETDEYRHDPHTNALFVLVPKPDGWLVVTVLRFSKPRRAKVGGRQPWPGRGNRKPVEAFA